MPGRSRSLASALFVAALASSGAARASTGLESPDAGVPQIGRGGAWFVRADDPLAAFFNPAALVRLPFFSAHAGTHVLVSERCFSRVNQDGSPVSPGPGFPGPGAITSDGSIPPPAATCAIPGPFFNPQFAVSIRPHERVAIGLAVLGPHGSGRSQWPETVPWTSRFGVASEQPAPNRFQLISSASTLLFPTLSVAVKVSPELALGAGFIWGVSIAEFTTYSEATSPVVAQGQVPSDGFASRGETRSRLNVVDPFVPGFVVSALWTPSPRLEVAAWFKWLDAIDTTGDLYLESLLWNNNGKLVEDPCAGQAAGCNVTDPEANGGAPAAERFRLQIPMEAKLGVRYRHPHPRPKAPPGWAKRYRDVRDSLSQDLFDIEANFTWANNSSVDKLEIRFRDGIPVAGTPGFVPVDASRIRNWKDVFGARLGGDVTILPGVLALRAGGFFETAAVDPRYLSLDFHNSWKLGLGAGGVVRVGPVDFNVAYQHTFYGTIDNCQRDANGVATSCNALGLGLSGDKSAGNRTRQATNAGKLDSQLNEVGLSGSLRF